jgi:hypothetical protein
MDIPTTRRCHGFGKGTHNSKEGYKILEHTIELTFKSLE